MDNGENTDGNDCEASPEGSNIDCNGHKCLVNIIESNSPSSLVDLNGLLALLHQLGHEDHHVYGQSHKVHHSRNDNKVGKTPRK